MTTRRPKSQLIPTNNVTTKDGQTVRTRIDTTLTVAEVIQQLVISLKIPHPPDDFALRDENDELVTDDNLRKKIKNKSNLRLVNAPRLEAIDIVEKLYSKESENRNNKLRMVLFNLAKFINEEQFANEFLRMDGLRAVVEVINSSHGNPLAYALNAMHNLMELDYGWSELGNTFIFRVVQILSSPISLLNVCRPATTILKRLVEADPRFSPGPAVGSSNPSGANINGNVTGKGVYRYGFNVVYAQMGREADLLETVVGRLGSADSVMALNSMMLINTLLSYATDEHWDNLTSELERLNIRKAVINLMSGQTAQSEDLSSSILDFQANYVRLTHRRKTTPVDPNIATHKNILEFLWASSKMEIERLPSGEVMKWGLLGFESEEIGEEFHDVGMLGLDCLKVLVLDNPDFFAKAVYEQNSRPRERQCPVALASNEVVELLSEHWSIFAPGYSTSTEFQPFLLDFYRIHALATQFFIRMWNESGAAAGDFSRVAALVRSQIKMALQNEQRPLHELTAMFLDSEYRDVRDRQMKELELEDDLLNKIPVRNLRAKLFKESYEFVKKQRLYCLMQGAWFLNGISTLPGKDTARRPQRPWRFLRLDNSMKYLHYTDSPYKFQVRNGFEDLPERIEVASIQEIAVNSCTAPVGVAKESVDLAKTATASNASQHSFSLIGDLGPIAHQVATDASRWADWTDGLNMLRKDGGHVATPETAGFVHALTEIGLKIRLLDLSGERVDIPSTLTTGLPPPTAEFFFADLNYESAP